MRKKNEQTFFERNAFQRGFNRGILIGVIIGLIILGITLLAIY